MTLRKLKEGKALGPDQIDNTFLRNFADVLTKRLTIIFNRIVIEKYIPEEWGGRIGSVGYREFSSMPSVQMSFRHPAPQTKNNSHFIVLYQN